MNSAEPSRRSFRLSQSRRELLAARRHAHGASGGPGERIPRRPDGEPPPLSFGQQRLWFLAQLAPASPAYNLTALFRLAGALDPAALAASFAEIVRRHEVLRTTLPLAAGRPVQEVAPPPAAVPPLPLVDLAGLADAAAVALGLAGAEHRLPFDLARGPLLRPRLLRLGPDSWALAVTLHHVVADGWSVGLLLREVAALYDAFAAGRPSPLPALAIQYGDYARWRRGPELAEPLAADLAWWRERLAGAPMLLELPADRPRAAAASDRGASLETLLPAELAAELAGLGREQGATPFMVLAAGFAVLLGRLTGQDDLLFGTPVAGRDRVELSDLIGFFVNTLVLRLDLGGAPSFRELLRRTRDAVFGALAHQGAPFELLVQELAPERRPGRTPIVQAMLALQNAPMPPLALGDLALAQVPVPVAAAHFELELSLTERAAGLACLWSYARELVDPATVRRWAAHWAALLAAAARDAGRPAGELPWLAAGERHQLVREWNATATAVAGAPEREACLHELIESQAGRTPDRVALACGGESLTYGELDRRAGRLADRLRALGVGPEVRVAVAMERSPELLVALLAVLKSGGAYLPLDPSYPAERLAFMLADARAPVLLTQQRLRGLVPAAAARVLCLDGAEDLPAFAAWPVPRAARALPDSLAYVIYTSGSTGRPKGSMIAHRAIVNRLLWMQEAYALAAGEAVLQKTPISFDVSVWELFWPLVAGARLVLARPGGHQDGVYLAALVAAEQVTTLHFVPSMLEVFLAEPRLRECAGLRLVIASGEALSPEHEARFRSRFAEVCAGGADGAGPAAPLPGLHNLYGPTEAAVDVTAWACDGEGRRRGRVPIGRPIANLSIHLLDRAGAPVPPGVAGHLHIGGAGLARGYLDRPGLTAERFVPDGLAGDGGRLYATGDLARRRADGAVEFLGRIDDRQVKLRGFRVELGECEAALCRHPGVAACAVLLREDAPGDRRLVAYLVPRGGSCPTHGELLGWLRRELPEHMIPAAFVPLGQLPLTANGKLDRGALPAPGAERPQLAVSFAPAETELERSISVLWRRVLGLEQVGVHDNFFDLGGDSFRLFELHRGLLETVGRDVPLMQLFQHTTIQSLAAHLAAGEPGRADAALARGRGGGRKAAMLERRLRRAGQRGDLDLEGPQP